MPTNRRKDQQNEADHRMQSYSDMKRHEVLTHATKWMNLENIMPSESNMMYDSIKCTEIESRSVAAKGWGPVGGQAESRMMTSWVHGFLWGTMTIF